MTVGSMCVALSCSGILLVFHDATAYKTAYYIAVSRFLNFII